MEDARSLLLQCDSQLTTSFTRSIWLIPNSSSIKGGKEAISGFGGSSGSDPIGEESTNPHYNVDDIATTGSTCDSRSAWRLQVKKASNSKELLRCVNMFKDHAVLWKRIELSSTDGIKIIERPDFDHVLFNEVFSSSV